jgi:hypothetical protein
MALAQVKRVTLTARPHAFSRGIILALPWRLPCKVLPSG